MIDARWRRTACHVDPVGGVPAWHPSTRQRHAGSTPHSTTIMESSLPGHLRDARLTRPRAAHPHRTSDGVTALLDDLAALLERPDRPACMERLHLAGRVCADLRVDGAVRRHVARRTDTLITALNDAMLARASLATGLPDCADAHEELRTLRADAAAAHDRLAASLDAFEGDETITAAARSVGE
jgi:hypothetical protein